MARKSKNRQRRSNTKAADPAPVAADSIEQIAKPDPADVCSVEPISHPSESSSSDDHRVLDAVDSNTQLLEKIQSQLEGLCEGIVSQMNHSPQVVATEVANAEAAIEESDQTNELRDRIYDFEAQVGELEQQNIDLVAKLASASAANVVRAPNETDETLTWEDRKQLILQQMENDRFDTDEFEDSLSENPNLQLTVGESPAAYVQRMTAELARREKEISDLHHLLEQQSEVRETGVSIGAAGIAEMIESDELVCEERERLQQLQVEWEDKFRQSEIEASLERARLSRERRELATKQTELDNELESVRLKKLQASEKDGPRRWLSQLGLSAS